MPNFSVWVRGALALSIVCHVALLWRLWREGLVRPYPRLALFLAVDLTQSLLVLPFDVKSVAYRNVVFVSSPFIWLLSYFVVLELYRLILEDYPGISSAGRKAVTWCLILAIGISVSTVIPSLNSSESGPFVFKRFFFSVERSVILGLLIFLVLIQLFLARYRLRLSRNRMLYSTGYALYFGLGMAFDVIAVELLQARVFGPISVGIVAVSDLILLTGAFVLARQGEFRPASDTGDTSAERVHLQQQLAEMNRLLTRAARGS